MYGFLSFLPNPIVYIKYFLHFSLTKKTDYSIFFSPYHPLTILYKIVENGNGKVRGW